MSLYRYLTFEGAKATLEKATLKVTPQSCFNDPFDMDPPWRMWPTFGMLRAAYRDLAPSESFWNFCVGSIRNWSRHQEVARQKFLRNSDGLWGAVCFSRVKNSIPMWAYYADDHTGLVIEFDENHPALANLLGGNLKDVRYRRFRRPFRKLGGGTNHLYDKSITWKHEREVRLLYPCKILGVEEATINGKRAWLLPFPKDSIKTVFLGCRISPDDEKSIREGLSKWGYSFTSVVRMKTHSKRYLLIEE